MWAAIAQFICTNASPRHSQHHKTTENVLKKQFYNMAKTFGTVWRVLILWVNLQYAFSLSFLVTTVFYSILFWEHLLRQVDLKSPIWDVWQKEKSMIRRKPCMFLSLKSWKSPGKNHSLSVNQAIMAWRQFNRKDYCPRSFIRKIIFLLNVRPFLSLWRIFKSYSLPVELCNSVISHISLQLNPPTLF